MGSFRFGSGIEMYSCAGWPACCRVFFHVRSLFNLLIFHAVPDVMFFQEEAISALEKFPTPASRLALTDILEQDQCFYKVRMQACFCLSKVGVCVCGCAHVCLREKKLTHQSHIQCQQHLSCWVLCVFICTHLAACLTALLQKRQQSLRRPAGGEPSFQTVHSHLLVDK